MTTLFRVPTQLELDTTTYARGKKSLKVTALAGVLTSSEYPLSDNPIPEPSVHLDFATVDNFDTYSDAGLDTTKWYNYEVWSTSGPLGNVQFPYGLEYLDPETFYNLPNNGDTFPFSCFGYEFGTIVNMNSLSGVSIYGRADDDVCLYMSVMDIDENRTEWTKVGYLPKRWGRLDASLSWGDCDSTRVQWVLFHYDCETRVTFWLDELILYGTEEDDKYKTWIPIYATDLETKRSANLKTQEIAGVYPAVLHPCTPDSMHGKFIFRTEFAQMDREIRFMRLCARKHHRLYFRAGAEGWPIYILGDKNEPMLHHGGYKTEITTDFVEASK